MKTFKDNAGRTWTIAVNVAAIKRVKGLLDVNLMESVEGDLLEQLSCDPVLLCDVIYAICKPEADAQNISDEQFGSAMAGDAIEQATAALLEELVEFFPLGKRRVLAKALEKLRAVEAKAVEYATAKLDDPALDKQINEALSDITDSALSLPPSPASSRGSSP